MALKSGIAKTGNGQIGPVDVTETFGGEAPKYNEPVPAGEYELRVVKAEFEYSKEKQTPGVSLEIAVDEGEYRNRRIFDSIWLTEKNKGLAGAMVKTMLGKIPTSLRSASAFEDRESFGRTLAEELVNATFTAKVKVEKDEAYGDKNRLVAARPKE